MKKVTGIGGVFFKSKDVAAIKEWYSNNLGFITTQWGASIGWGDIDPDNKHIHHTEWSPSKEDSDHYTPSTLSFMMNYRVDDLRSLVDKLRSEGVQIVGDIQEYEYGNFGWIMDPEGRKIELWQAVEAGFGDPPPVWKDRVTGIGGIYFKSDNPAIIKSWYKMHLGVEDRFLLRDLATNKETYIEWSPLPNNDPLFIETNKPYVFGYRVLDLPGLTKTLGIKIGSNNSAWILDPDGNKVLLRES